MKTLRRVAFIGNHLPRRCGIATFTHDLRLAIATARVDLKTDVIAMTDPGRHYEYPPEVSMAIHDDVLADYTKAAQFLNESRFDVVSLQHEYGIFGGPSGNRIVDLIGRIKLPIVTTLHTVLATPSAVQREVLGNVIQRSAKIIVMAEKGRELLQDVYRVTPSRIEVIPHGVPDFPFVEPNAAKSRLGFGGRAVILTFGLLSPNKGIESVIDAMPAIVRACPQAVYVVLGATHPNLVRQQGEAYRESLATRAHALGMDQHVVFVDQFVEQATLLEYISMCDVYVTPYLNEDQMTSGTLAYSFGLGKAVVSTPYWHANELLADGRGVLVPFGDSNAFGSEITALLTNDVRRQAVRRRAYKISREMTWAQTAKRYLAVFESARATALVDGAGEIDQAEAGTMPQELPGIRLNQLLSMCDDTGLLQHSVQTVPNRDHGYCVDDNARALLLSCALDPSCEVRLPATVTSRFAAFIQHAWNPQTGRFRNFMSFDRRWLEDSGSEDSHGRTLWALGVCAAGDASLPRRRWATALFRLGLPVVTQFQSPRAWAFTLLGLEHYCTLVADNQDAVAIRKLLSDKLLTILLASRTDAWDWFEESLAYDNARLPQALLASGIAMNHPSMVRAALRSLRWLMSLQTTPRGVFRPVGTDSYGLMLQTPRAFDQQPLEATATISACLAAWRVTGAEEWSIAARRAFAWFLGKNDLNASLVDVDSGSCFDGLHPDRPNENCGAESVLSYLLALTEMRGLAAAVAAPTGVAATQGLSLSA